MITRHASFTLRLAGGHLAARVANERVVLVVGVDDPHLGEGEPRRHPDSEPLRVSAVQLVHLERDLLHRAEALAVIQVLPLIWRRQHRKVGRRAGAHGLVGLRKRIQLVPEALSTREAPSNHTTKDRQKT